MRRSVPELIQVVQDLTGWNQTELADNIGVSQSTISKWASGIQVPSLDQWNKVMDALYRHPITRNLAEGVQTSSVPVMGYITAGGVIIPGKAHVPARGLAMLPLSMPVPSQTIAFVCQGGGLQPRYDNGDVLIVWREQRLPTEAYVGQEAVVRIADGSRWLREIRRSQGRNRYALASHNAKTIDGVTIDWVGQVHLSVRAHQLQTRL